MKYAVKTLGYHCYTRVLTRKHCGLPQCRPRVYIVAMQADSQRNAFKWQKKIELPNKALSIAWTRTPAKWVRRCYHCPL